MKSSLFIIRPIYIGVMTASLGIVHGVSAQELPLTGPAYIIADQAYKNYADKNYADAIKNAKEAIRLRPDLPRLKELLRDAENAQQQLFAPKAPQLNNRTSSSVATTASPSDFAYARNAFGFDQAKNYSAALRDLEHAIQMAPNNVNYVLLKIDLLQKSNHQQVQALLHDALEKWPNDASLLLLQAYYLQQNNQYDTARPLYLKALARTDIGEIPLYNARLIVADAALVAEDNDLLKNALQYRQSNDNNASERIRYSTLLQQDPTLAKLNTIQQPKIECDNTNAAIVCHLAPADKPSQRLYQEAYQLFQDKQYEEGLQVIHQALILAPDDTDLIDKESTAKRELSSQYAIKAHSALIQRDFKEAEIYNRKAIEYDPDNMTYRLVLIESLINQEKYKAAEQAATDAVNTDPDDPVPVILRGYLKQQQHQYQAALADYQLGLHNPYLSEADRRDVSLYIADAAMAAKDKPLQQRILNNLKADNPEVIWRQSLYDIYQQDKGLKSPVIQQPFLECRDTPYETACTIRPMDNASDHYLSAIYQEIHQKRYAQAKQHAQLIAGLYPNNQTYQYVYQQALIADGQPDTKQASSYSPPLSLAYLAILAPAPQQAAQIFSDMDKSQQLSQQNYRDAAYTALNANDKALAKQYLYRAVDASNNGDYPLAPQALYDTRSSISNLDRKWGITASASYRGDSSVNNIQDNGTGKKKVSTANNSLQLITEAYYRPDQFNKNNRYLDFYGRLVNTAYGQSSATGLKTLLGAVGVRVKPFSGYNFIFSFERQIKLGSASQGDWLARAAYSHSKGTEFRVDKDSWFTHQFYGEIGHYLEANTSYFVSEEQVGRSYKLPNSIWSNTTLFPHAVIAADYNTAYQKALAIGAGPGITLRHWFREDTYHAPQSYLDFSVQYRFKIAGDERAKGLVARVSLNY